MIPDQQTNRHENDTDCSNTGQEQAYLREGYENESGGGPENEDG